MATTISASSGGYLSRWDRAAVTFPPKSLTADTEVTISTPAVRMQAEEDKRRAKLEEAGLISVSTGAVFGPEGLKLAPPATLRLPYDPAWALQLGVAEQTFQLASWDADKQQWRTYPSTIDPLRHTATAQVTVLGFYKVVARPPDPKK